MIIFICAGGRMPPSDCDHDGEYQQRKQDREQGVGSGTDRLCAEGDVAPVEPPSQPKAR
jgi:hypothetical protein